MKIPSSCQPSRESQRSWKCAQKLGLLDHCIAHVTYQNLQRYDLPGPMGAYNTLRAVVAFGPPSTKPVMLRQPTASRESLQILPPPRMSLQVPPPPKIIIIMKNASLTVRGPWNPLPPHTVPLQSYNMPKPLKSYIFG